MDDKIQIWMYEWIYGITECIYKWRNAYMDDEMHILMLECKNRWRNVFMDTKYLNTWITEYLNTWTTEYLNTWMTEYLNTWTTNCMYEWRKANTYNGIPGWRNVYLDEGIYTWITECIPGWRNGCCISMMERILRRPSAISFFRAGIFNDSSRRAAVTAGDRPRQTAMIFEDL